MLHPGLTALLFTHSRRIFCRLVIAVCRRNTKNGKCAACEQPTQGIFNIATDILKKMKKAKDAAPKDAAAAGEEGD
jgi:ribosomal protein L34E